MNSQVDHPAHYNNGVPGASRPALKALSGLSDAAMDEKETIAAMVVAFSPTTVFWFCTLSAFKYISRAGDKGPPLEDYAKARWYCKYALGLKVSLAAEKLKPRLESTIRELEKLGAGN